MMDREQVKRKILHLLDNHVMLGTQQIVDELRGVNHANQVVPLLEQLIAAKQVEGVSVGKYVFWMRTKEYER